MMPVRDIAGQRFGRLLVIERAGKTTFGEATWRCVCDCGQERVVPGGDLRRGKRQSCGCQRIERGVAANLKHGHAARAARGRRPTPEYQAWQSMRSRCHNPKDPGYPRYGGRGIAVCDLWRDSFEAFLADMGLRPSPDHSIDRIDNDRGYEPTNCRWTTADVQAKNRRPATRRADGTFASRT